MVVAGTTALHSAVGMGAAMGAKRRSADDEDGTPHCGRCRNRGVLVQLVERYPGGRWECPECEAAIWTDEMRLTWEEFVAGEDCRGCGKPLRRASSEPSWYSKGTAFYSAQEQAAAAAEEAAFQEHHAICNAVRWSIQGRAGVHCGRCCPPPPLSPRQLRAVMKIASNVKTDGAQPPVSAPQAPAARRRPRRDSFDLQSLHIRLGDPEAEIREAARTSAKAPDRQQDLTHGNAIARNDADGSPDD
ncbi:hypothetical protein Airi02_039210 [Actinoallomurus iriomotensis]|uniref:Uncharacterized protein n=1 Tax=Actinoallomurus iriomotensis TaxID=478107 RepID=A0A9W6S5A2_9ACTN|nr:hypothetical protein Airi02_039210 [Actinoallomurus iriomotensis]